MNEIQRREYLSAEGIDLHCPREILPTEKQIKEQFTDDDYSHDADDDFDDPLIKDFDEKK